MSRYINNYLIFRYIIQQFSEENDSKFTLVNTDAVVKQFQADDRIASVSSRVIATGMISSPTTASGVKIYGINPASEISQIALNESVREGTYFDSGKDNEILIGEKLAKKHKIKLKSKVVLTFTSVNSEIVSGAFRVGGIYRSKNISLDEVNVYVQQDHLRGIVGIKAF